VTPFDFAAERLEASTPFSRLEARGTLRIALRDAGLDASAGPEELAIVLRKVLPDELVKHGIEAGDGICENIARHLAQQAFDAAEGADSPEAVFQRIGGS
jgi:hypothetical protein